ncbi:NAD-dependent epimerase/dehydratase family protein [Pseudalkalibacillus decolorationis]|uniref:NAD-dependent epimerase/dehydratase family protein n=1 Tax=Pseudalkalibacillus decolorationis TaxID=163879 RepID=UPI00214732BB|nr:NAD(P)-dependent oxidoreductase [Pseudalkalibacillus decolorationis]
MKTLLELENKMTKPSKQLVKDIQKIDGDIMILGVGGKMGPSLAKLAKNAVREVGINKKIIGTSRFSSNEVRMDLESLGIETIAADLLDQNQLNSLPDVKNIIYMAGYKFGTFGNESYTWAMNTYLPGIVSEKFKNSRIVSFSSGNVYPFTKVSKGGADETNLPGPIGEYAQSCLGRERIFEYFARLYNIKMVHFRLNYAIDLRYGVLLEIARNVFENKPIDLTTGHVNVIWQGDANEMAIRSLLLVDSPPLKLNITGPETISIKWLAEQYGQRFGKTPIFINDENSTALLSNASKAHKLLGYPKVTLRQMIDWIANWVEIGGMTINKPTNFQEREGAF